MPLFPAVSRRTLRTLAGAVALIGTLSCTSPALASYDATITGTPGLLSFWKLDETSGTVGADATGAFPGTYSSNAGLAVSGAPGIPGSRGIAPVATTLGVPSAHPFTGTAPYTLEAWVKPSSAQSSYNFIIDREVSSPSRSGYTFGITPGTTSPANALFCERWSNGTQRGLSSSVGLTIGVWYHVACTFDGTNLTLAINGQINRTTTAGAIPDSSAVPLRIGGNANSTGSRIQGTVDNVAVYSRALSAAELSSHAVAGQTYKDEIRGAPGLRSHYALDALSSSQPDLGPANVTASLSGTTASFGSQPLTSGGDASVTLRGDGPLNAPALQMSNPGSTELWFRPQSLQTAWLWYGSTTTTGDGGGPEQETGIRVTAGGRLQLWSTGPTPSYVDLGSYAPGESHQLVISISGSIWRIFVDGAQVYASTLATQNFTSYLARTSYGALFDGSAAFTGQLDDISTYSLALSASDVADHWALGRDQAAPETTITSGPPESSVQSATTATLDGSASESLLSSPGFRCSLDGAPATACTLPVTYSGLADGPHTVAIAARDAAGNVDSTPATRSFTVDTTAPVVTIDSGPSGPTTTATATFQLSVNDPAATLSCRIDGGTAAACTSPVSLSGLADGPHEIAITATDAAGNRGSTVTRSWTVDTTPPAVSVDSAPAASVTGRSATIRFTLDDPAGAAECRLDGGSWAPCTSPVTLSDLPLGDRTFEVRAADAAGNTGAARRVQWAIAAAPAPLVEGTTPKPTTPTPTPKTWTSPLVQIGTAQLFGLSVPASSADRATFSFQTNKRTKVQIRAWCRASVTDCPPRRRALRDDDDAATARLVFVSSMLVSPTAARTPSVWIACCRAALPPGAT